MGVFGTIFMIIIILLVVYIVTSCVRIVPQAQAYVIERLGAYNGTWSVGMHFKVPFIDRVAKKVLLKEQVVDFAPQPVITADNVTMRIDTVIFFQITDPKLYAYGVENPILAIENLTATTLRNIIGDLELDETLTSRETINTKMRASLDTATDPWGIKVNRVELKNIIPPAAIQDGIEKQMKAEREKRESILRSQGEKESAILVAQGNKEAAILDAEADKQAAILKAEAAKEATIREAEGRAQAILAVQKANADGIRFLKEKLGDCLSEETADSMEMIISSVETAKECEFNIKFDPTLVRGQSYYTGTIFEVTMDDFGGSVAGGGRYDKMIGKFTGQDTPACGFSIGFERIVMLLLENGYEVPTVKEKKAYLLEKKMTKEGLLKVMSLAKADRQAGKQVLIVNMKKNKKFQKEQLTEDGYTEIVDCYADSVENL